MGANTGSLNVLYDESCKRTLLKSLKEDKHPLHCKFEFLRSGKRLYALEPCTGLENWPKPGPARPKFNSAQPGPGPVTEVISGPGPARTGAGPSPARPGNQYSK